ncbi:diaminopimelate epimerase [Verrucomicrobiaceae bacterium R5-34]|uniref:Diaminopimelate epimerase n=1 Tax=Oceaniferula flava TaxID=2800421 RepID=A0AAE2SBK8_9BACT|nr:diaminopimelate epimerase [Oceaniferula flavus]MBK1830345.1 diaminopimelate epimerase [Verrucomicrobiaceae bacterium R5-34]MBK1854437.1 diaminopimelate epimerase [Oceaniferula flavus]MBM1135743.1 diaminopimelate epimerase [Oceaniferula flavus]
MQIPFQKMNGAGNDFVVIDNRDLKFQLSKEQIALLCDRQRGVGADGLLAVEPAEKGADFKFRYYNADGGEAEMCGNGARCFGKYTAALLGEGTSLVTFETIAGTLSAQIIGDNVCIAMSEPFDLALHTDIKVDGLDAEVHVINTGVPHVVVFVDDLKNTDVLKYGAALRYHEHFAPAGTNVNFTQVLDAQHIAIRTYERGVEGETLACGTGMTACALIHHLLNDAASPVSVDVEGGETLEIGFIPESDKPFTGVTLTGPADFVFAGEITI